MDSETVVETLNKTVVETLNETDEMKKTALDLLFPWKTGS
jgi:hypothetical protein